MIQHVIGMREPLEVSMRSLREKPKEVWGYLKGDDSLFRTRIGQ